MNECRVCGLRSVGGRSRYTQRDASFCSEQCRQRWYSIQRSPDAGGWKWREVLRLRALLEQHGHDWHR